MTFRRVGTVVVAAWLAATGALPAVGARGAPPHPVVHRVELGTLGGTGSVATDINDHGQVVGHSTTADGVDHAFVWQHGAMTDLHVGGTGSAAQDINNRGQIVGTRTLTDGSLHGFLWQRGHTTDLGPVSGRLYLNELGQVAGSAIVSGERHVFSWRHGVRTYLPLPPFWCCAEARGIDDRGDVIGSAINGESFEGALIWRDGVVTDLGSLSTGLPMAIPLGINNRGQVTGYSFTDDGAHAFRWQHGAMSDLGTLGGAQSEGVDINADGHVAGTSETITEGTDHAFLSRAGGLADLGALDAQNSRAAALNDHNEVVGVLQRPTGDEDFTSSAFAWRHGTMTDLGAGLHFDTAATGVNNRGQMIGSATRNGADKAVLWTITP